MRQDLDEIYVSDFCDHCAWVETFVREKGVDAEIFDCKPVLNRPGIVRARSRRTGAVKLQEALGVPMMFRYDSQGHALILVGAEAILRELGGTCLASV